MIEAIIHGIENLPADFKAEAIVSQLAEAGLDEKHLYVRLLHAARRPFSRDVLKAENITLKNDDEALQLTLTRSALYDLLPEGLFFGPPALTGRKQSAAEMAEEYRIAQRQEKKVRDFFAPLEQAFFEYRCKSYEADRHLLHSLEAGLLNDYLLNFWDLHPAIPQPEAVRLVLLLPFVHRLAGDKALMARALQAVIRRPVECRGYYQWDQRTATESNVLGTMVMGTDATCDVSYIEDDYVFDFRIGFGNEGGIQDYLEGGGRYHLLQAFYRYFVPANAEAKTTLAFEAREKGWRLGNEPAYHLGISSLI